MQPQHIGIVGCSAEGAALCYRTICLEGEKYSGQYGHPQVSMHTHSLAEYVKCLNQNDWAGVGELMLSSANKLAKAGANFLICPDNTIHHAIPLIENRLPLLWLHIADTVIDEAVQCGYKNLAITGTQWLVDSDVYPSKITERGLTWHRPAEAEKLEINRIIMQELVCGKALPSSTQYLQNVILSLKQVGCDAVILGCTELPILINDANSSLPTLNSTRLLALAALKKAINKI